MPGTPHSLLWAARAAGGRVPLTFAALGVSGALIIGANNTSKQPNKYLYFLKYFNLKMTLIHCENNGKDKKL